MRGLGVTVHDEGRGTLPFTVAGSGSVRGGDGDHRRLRVQPVRLRPAARRGTVRRGSRRPARRQARAVAPAHRDDRRPAPQARRRRGRLGAEQVARPARAGARRRRTGRAGPVQRRAVPGGGDWSPAAASPCWTGRGRPRRPATRCARSSTLMGAEHRAHGPGAHRHRDGPAARARLRPARRRRAHAGGRSAVPDGRHAVTPAGHRAPPRPRDRPARCARRPSSTSWAVHVTADRGRADHPADARSTRGVFRTYDDHRMAHARGARGARRPRSPGREHRHHVQDLPRLRRAPGRRCSGELPTMPRYDETTSSRYDRPRRHTRPRTKDRPSYDDAVAGRVVTVDRGRYTYTGRGRTWSPR